MTYSTSIAAIRKSHGKPFLAPTDSFTPATLDALRGLAVEAGLTPSQATNARPTDLVRIYATACSANSHLTPSVAQRMGAMIDKRAGVTAPAPVTPAPAMPAPQSPPEPVQSPAPAPVDLTPVMAVIDALRAEIETLKASRPLAVEVSYPDTIAAPVLIANAHPIMPKVLHFAKCRKNVFIWGPRGSGKSTLAEQVATALGLDFYATGPIHNISRLTGYVNPFDGTYHGTDFRKAFEHGGLFSADEITAGDPEVLLALNMALAQKYYPFPDGIVLKHPDFVLVASDNTDGGGATDEYNGRAKLDDSFMDRFALVPMGYDETLERAIAANAAWADHVQRFRAIATREGCRVPSPRATYDGADMINDGMAWADVEEAYLYRGMEETELNRMRSLMGAN